MVLSQINLSRFLLCTGAIGSGLGCLGFAIRSFASHQGGLYSFVLLLAAGPLIGAGVLGLSGLFRLGLYVGFFGQIIGWLTVYAYWAGWRDATNHWSIRGAICATAFVICLAVFQTIRTAHFALRRRAIAVPKSSSDEL
jgi:hypothetical protein